MKFLRGIFVVTTAALASTTVSVTGATSSQLLDEPRVVSEVGVAFAPINDNVDTYNGGKKSAAQHHAQKSRRMAERRTRVIAAIAAASNVDVNNPQGDANESSNNDDKARSRFLSRMTEDELEQAYLAAEASSRMRGLKVDEFNEGGEFIRRATQELKDNEEEIMHNGGRKLWGNGGNSDPYKSSAGLAEETGYYDKWQQAYRFLGAYIDCTHSWSQGGHSHDNNNNQEQNAEQGCSRWMIWAAYADPNYAGGGYDEYFGDGAEGSLDCHSPDSDWMLIGVYKQEFYQYIEQISKHLWAVNEYEYIVALAGLKYMTNNQCTAIGYDENGNRLYSEVQPLEGGNFQMGLYSDAQCITLNTQTKYTYDDFAAVSELNLGSKDKTDDDSFHTQAYQYWQETQEYTFTNLNTVYNDYKFCTSCVDYPTYQDGYFIGDDGKDDDDLINQCWKFYSHDSYNCDADCLAMGTEQGSISWISYNGKQFGTLIEGQYEKNHDETTLEGVVVSSSSGAHRIERLKANLFLTFAGIVFVITFLAFAVARGSSKKKKTSHSRSRRLLDTDYGGGEGRRSSSRSQSRSRRLASSGGDAKSVRSSRSKSRSRSTPGKSVKSSSRSKSRSGRVEYEPPSSSTGEKKARSLSRSRKSTTVSSRRHEE